jgi:hypothetical protein
MSTPLAAYDYDDDVIYEPPHRIPAIDIAGECCSLKFFDHVDPTTGEADIDTATEPRAIRGVHRAARHAVESSAAADVSATRTQREDPGLHEADTFPHADEVLVVSVIDDTAHLDVHRADPDLRRPIYPARGTIRVPAADLIQALQAHIEEEEADPPPQTPRHVGDS